MKKQYIALTIIASLFVQAACTDLPERANSSIDSAEARANRLGKQINLGQARHTDNSRIVQIKEGIWLGKTTVSAEPPPVLPSVFYQPVSFDRTVADLAEFGERIALRTNLSVRVTPDALGIANTGNTSNASGAAKGKTSSSSPNTPPIPSGGPSGGPLPNSSTSSSSGQAKFLSGTRILYSEGNLKGLLDTVATKFGVSWRYANNEIVFYNTDTRTFRVAALAGDASVNASIAGGGAAGSSAKMGAGFDSQMSIWKNMEKALETIISPVGKIAVSPATGTVTVTDTPLTLNQIGKYIEEQNRSMSKQIILNVTILGVTLTDQDAYGIDWNLIQRSVRNFGFKTNLGIDSNTSPGTLSAGILSALDSSDKGTPPSSVLIQALSTQGKVRRETAAAIAALNNQPVPLQVGKQTSYLASVSTTQVQGGTPQTSLTPGTITSGFSMTLLPYILDNGTIMLQFSTDLSSLKNLVSFSSGGNTVQLPETEVRSILQRVSMKSGETLVISGFEQTDDNTTSRGVGNAQSMLFGGDKKTGLSKEILIIIVTPVLLRSI